MKSINSVIDKKIKVPLHYQIYLDMLKKIQGGEFKPGEKIPSEAELERIYDVSRITVRGAVEMLAQEGIVEKNRGKKGTIVCRPKHSYDMGKLTSFTDDVHMYGENASSELLEFRELIPKKEIAQQLGLGPQEEVYYIERKRCRQNTVVGLHKAYIRKISGLKLEAGSFKPDASLYVMLRESGILPTTAKETLEVKIPSERVLSILGLAPRTAVFHKKRITCSEEERPFEYVEMFYNPDYYQYKIELRLN